MEKQEKYSDLDEFLKTGMAAAEIGHELDETLCDLVHYAEREGEYSGLSNRYYLIKKLRDIFWAIEKQK